MNIRADIIVIEGDVALGRQPARTTFVLILTLTGIVSMGGGARGYIQWCSF